MARMTPWREWTSSPRGLLLCSLLAITTGLSAAVRLAPAPAEQRSRVEYSGAEQEARRATAYYERAWGGVRIVQLRDSLRRLERPGVSFLLDPRMPRERRAGAEERLRAAWSALAVHEARTPVVLYLQAPDAPAARRNLRDPSFVSLPMAAGEPCIVVLGRYGLGSTVARDARALRYSMYGCALMAEFGLPGAGMLAELKRIGWLPIQLNLDRRYYYFYSDFATTLGIANSQMNEGTAAYLACLAGKRSACDEASARPSARLRELPPGTSRTGRISLDASLLALLRASLSPADFGRLWRDNRPFAVAVADITGRSKGEWVRLNLLRGSHPLWSSFAPTTPIVSRALIYLLLAAALSIAVQSRRTVR